MQKSCLAVLLMVVVAPSVFADQVTLKNGDRLTGSIITSDPKTLVLKTDYAGAVTIKWDFVQQVESSQPLYVGTKAGQVIVGPVTTSDDKLAVATKEAGSVTVAKADVTSLRNADEQKKAEATIERLEHPRLSDLWGGSLDTGLGLVRGNSESSNFTFGLNAVRATTRDKIIYYTTSAFNRSTINGVTATTAQTVAGGVRYDLNLSEKSFAFGTVDLFNDRFQDLDLRTVLGAGGGLHAIKNAHTSLDLTDWRHLRPGVLYHVKSIFRGTPAGRNLHPQVFRLHDIQRSAVLLPQPEFDGRVSQHFQRGPCHQVEQDLELANYVQRLLPQQPRAG